MPAHRTKRADGRYSVTVRLNPDGTTRTRGHRTDSDRAGAEHGSGLMRRFRGLGSFQAGLTGWSAVLEHRIDRERSDVSI